MLFHCNLKIFFIVALNFLSILLYFIFSMTFSNAMFSPRINTIYYVLLIVKLVILIGIVSNNCIAM